jgi:hypothetical protein
MDQHLTVSEARKFTGKSDSTIKRLIRDVVLEAQHPERSFILPSHGEVERRKKAKEPYVWKIDRELLRRRFGVGGQTTDVEESPRQVTGGRERDIVLQVLREQLQSKDDQLRTLEGQLDRKDEQISNWNERMRESNILMKELQQRLSIAAPVAQTSRADVVDASKKGKKPVETRTEKLKSSGKEWTQNRSFLRWFTIR